MIGIKGVAPRLRYPVVGTVLADGDTAARGWPDQRKGVQVEIRVPHIPAGERRKRPTAIDQEAVKGGELFPIAVFISDYQAPVVAGPQLAGMVLVFDREDIVRWLGLQRMFIPLQDGPLACETPQLVRP